MFDDDEINSISSQLSDVGTIMDDISIIFCKDMDSVDQEIISIKSTDNISMMCGKDMDTPDHEIMSIKSTPEVNTIPSENCKTDVQEISLCSHVQNGLNHHLNTILSHDTMNTVNHTEEKITTSCNSSNAISKIIQELNKNYSSMLNEYALFQSKMIKNLEDIVYKVNKLSHEGKQLSLKDNMIEFCREEQNNYQVKSITSLRVDKGNNVEYEQYPLKKRWKAKATIPKGNVLQDVKPITIIFCKQISIDNVASPLIPPSHIVGRDYTDNANASRQYYRQEIAISKKHRKYVVGALHKNLFRNCAKIIDIREYGGTLDLSIKTESNEQTTVRLRDNSRHDSLLKDSLLIASSAWLVSKVRVGRGDLGTMSCLGLCSRKLNGTNRNYASMNRLNEELRNTICAYMKRMKCILSEILPDETETIVKSLKRQNIAVGIDMGGDEGLSASVTITKNYCNAPHIDLDDSKTMILQLEENIGNAKDWATILENTTMSNDQHQQAIVITNYSGLLIGIDAKIIRHATSLRDQLSGEHVYGIGFYSKLYKYISG